MKFEFIAAEKADQRVARLAFELGIPRACYYAWSKRPESRQASEERRLGHRRS